MQKTLDEFYKNLGQRESSGNYKVENKFGFLGKYQMGRPAMIDAGYYVKNSGSNVYSNNWNEGHFTGKDGVYSKNDFLNNPVAQENAQRHYKQAQWNQLKAVGADKYIGKTINGVKITPSGLLGAAHLKGAPFMGNYLRNNGNVPNRKDGFGTTVEEYLERFRGYDVSSVTGVTDPEDILDRVYNRPQYDVLKKSPAYKNGYMEIPTGFSAPIEQTTPQQVSFTPEQIGKMSREEFDKNESSIMQQLQTGGINQKSSKDLGGYRNSHTGDNRIYTAEDIGNFSSSEFNHHEPAINAQMNSIGIPTNNDMQNSGGTFYIAPYTRSDGVQVSGHYRSK